jgi:pimeloyl-ACP methyl ester carboxylesterase
VRKLAGLLPDATLTVLRDVGHLVHYEKPREAAEQIASVAGVAVA